MKFAYARYQVTPSLTAPNQVILYRPHIPVRFVGPNGFRDVYALVDTGADESFVTESMAEKLGVVPLSDETFLIHSASGSMSVWYGRITIEIADHFDEHSISVVVGVVSQDWTEMILGHIGFLEFFDATFSDTDRTIELIRR
jgi:predicted aspartyl protease